MLLTKEQILSAQDLPREMVSVPEWGGEVIVRSMTAAERDRYEQSALKRRGEAQALDNIRASLCAACIVGEDGQPLFGEDDVIDLGAKSARALDRVFAVASRLSGFGNADAEDLAGN